MKDVYQTLNRLGISLPEAGPAPGVFNLVRRSSGVHNWCAGCGPALADGSITGALGAELGVEQGQEAARRCIINLLANIHAATGDLNAVRFIKLNGFVRSTPDFTEQSAVMDAASELVLELFGEDDGLPARTTIGVAQLPGGIAVEIDAVFELRDEIEL